MKPSSEALALGQMLVEQLDLDDRRDLLTRWMASDIAVKLDAASASDATAESKQACADAIYALWSHRADLPKGSRPFEALEKVAQLLLDLDPSNPRPFYYRPTAEPGVKDDLWIKAATSCDQVARTLITYCLQQAAIGRGLEPTAWVEFAESAGLEAPEGLVVRILYGTADEEEDTNVEILREADRLKGLLSNLAYFRKSSALIAGGLRAQLAALGPLPPRPRTGPKRGVRKRAAKTRQSSKT